MVFILLLSDDVGATTFLPGHQVKRSEEGKKSFCGRVLAFLGSYPDLPFKIPTRPSTNPDWERGGAFKFPGFLENFKFVLNLGEIWEDIETG